MKTYHCTRLSNGDGKTVCGFTSCKNDRDRVIEPADSVLELLQGIHDKQNQRRLVGAPKPYNPDKFVFTKPDGSAIQYQTMYKHFKKVVSSIGLPEVRFHDLRHTFATLSLQNGVDIKTVSASPGHATVAFTLDRYGQISHKMMHNAA